MSRIISEELWENLCRDLQFVEQVKGDSMDQLRKATVASGVDLSKAVIDSLRRHGVTAYGTTYQGFQYEEVGTLVAKDIASLATIQNAGQVGHKLTGGPVYECNSLDWGWGIRNKHGLVCKVFKPSKWTGQDERFAQETEEFRSVVDFIIAALNGQPVAGQAGDEDAEEKVFDLEQNMKSMWCIIDCACLALGLDSNEPNAGDLVDKCQKLAKHEEKLAIIYERCVKALGSGNEDVMALTDICNIIEHAPVPVVTVPSVFDEVRAELSRAITKFPTWPTDPLHAVAVLGEEFGELTQAVLQSVYEPNKSNPEEVRKEAIQTVATAIRFLASLDRYEYRPGSQHEQDSILTRMGQGE